MQNLKFSLMSIGILSICSIIAIFSSCTKSDIKDISHERISLINENDKLTLPHGINEDINVRQLLKNASIEQINTWNNNKVVSSQLASIGKLNEVASHMEFGENISELSLNEILSAIDMDEYNQTGSIETRGCAQIWSGCDSNFCYSIYKCCAPPYGNCYYYYSY